MLSDKIGTLKQDLVEVSGALEELEGYNAQKLDGSNIKDIYEYRDLVNKFKSLEENLKEYLENAELAITYLR